VFALTTTVDVDALNYGVLMVDTAAANGALLRRSTGSTAAQWGAADTTDIYSITSLNAFYKLFTELILPVP